MWLLSEFSEEPTFQKGAKDERRIPVQEEKPLWQEQCQKGLEWTEACEKHQDNVAFLVKKCKEQPGLWQWVVL